MINVTISHIKLQADEILGLELASQDGPLPAWTPGAHIDLHLPNGLVRQYSLCGCPTRDTYSIAVLNAPHSRGGSSCVHSDLKAGAAIAISEPRNLFELNEDANAYTLVAAGIGITPILSMARRLNALKRPFVLHYCVRSQARAAFLEELKAVCGDQLKLHIAPDAVSQPDWSDLLLQRVDNQRLYVCGPDGFMDLVTQTAAAQGWPQERLHRESFVPGQTSEADDVPFEIEVASTGEVFTIPVGVSAASVLDAAGVFVPLSCEQGICGTCMTRVISGTPDHRDYFQTPEEKATNLHFTPCCSRSRSARLVVDL